MSDSAGEVPMSSRLHLGEVPAEVRTWRDQAQWRPGALRREERERLVRIGLNIVMGDRAGMFFVRRAPDGSIEIGDAKHSFGYPPDAVLGDDPRTVLAHDVEWLRDELCETEVAWAEQLPVCSIHPGSHAMNITVSAARIAASCPVTAEEVRSASF